ncbi:FAD-binding oxidoreductase [Aquibium sp. A9E412]|uniref:NAD(P)/FAD-dependent oxidoreductase n=1 Tax=Aquibium sp. A9E412 TaxID=2976767 RepID=UPI0025B105A6|nr:FAD-binding oxidoreductase [Aquibium sp. A9E412]MDN2567474.1 FAD-binding oxidoreductase [Aquibium sp. A9E412]
MSETRDAGEAAQGLWAASAATPPFEAPALSGERSVEVAVVGGGFTGLSVALHLAERGVSVALVEAQEFGHGASGRNGGQVNPGLKYGEAALAARFGDAGRGLYRLGQEAPDFLGETIAAKRLQCDWQQPGLIRLAHNGKALERLRADAATLRAQGVAAVDLDAAAVAARVGSRRYPGGLYDPRGASVQPLDLARELARAAHAAGAALFAGTPATALAQRAGRWQLDTPGGRLTARRVVVATNAYSDALVPRLARSLLPVNSFQVATAPLDARHATVLPGGETVYDSRRLVLYFRRSPDGRLVLGGRASFSSAQTQRADAPDYGVLETVLRGIFPVLDDLPITHRWTGLVGITPDFLPHYHALDDGLHVLVGFNGRGVALSHRLGAHLAAMLAGDDVAPALPAMPLRPFPLHRFRAPVLNLGMRWNHLLDRFGL